MKQKGICPKCGRELHKDYFCTPDETGVMSVVWHGTKVVKDLFGGEHISYTDGCFLKQNEWDRIADEVEVVDNKSKYALADALMDYDI